MKQLGNMENSAKLSFAWSLNEPQIMIAIYIYIHLLLYKISQNFKLTIGVLYIAFGYNSW